MEASISLYFQFFCSSKSWVIFLMFGRGYGNGVVVNFSSVTVYHFMFFPVYDCSSGSRIKMGGQGANCLVMALCLGPGEPKVLLGTYSE